MAQGSHLQHKMEHESTPEILNAKNPICKTDQQPKESPKWEPESPSQAAATASEPVRNSEVSKEEGKTKVTPFSMNRIIEDISHITEGWPRRVGKKLFVHTMGQEIDMITKPAALMGFLGTNTGKPSVFKRNDDCHTKEEVFQELQRTVRKYDGIENYPHHPIIDNHYYTCDFPSPGNGEALRKLVDKFNPESDVDRDLITVFFVSLFVGLTCPHE